jgi:SnoaL-like domain
MAEADNLQLARDLIDLWNAGDIEGIVALYTEDAAMFAGPEWPEQAEYHGHDGVRANIEQRRSVGVEPDRGPADRGPWRPCGGKRRLDHTRARERHPGGLAVRDPADASRWENRVP